MATMQSSTLRVGKPAQLAARHGIIEMSSMCSAESRMVTATLRGGNQRGGTVNEEMVREKTRPERRRHGQGGDTVKAEVETRSDEGARYLRGCARTTAGSMSSARLLDVELIAITTSTCQRWKASNQVRRVLCGAREAWALCSNLVGLVSSPE